MRAARRRCAKIPRQQHYILQHGVRSTPLDHCSDCPAAVVRQPTHEAECGTRCKHSRARTDQIRQRTFSFTDGERRAYHVSIRSVVLTEMPALVVGATQEPGPRQMCTPTRARAPPTIDASGVIICAETHHTKPIEPTSPRAHEPPPRLLSSLPHTLAHPPVAAARSNATTTVNHTHPWPMDQGGQPRTNLDCPPLSLPAPN